MQIDCPNCDAQYNISENIALEIEYIVQCTNCLEIWKYTFPRTQEKIGNKNIKVNKLHPQVSSDIQSILQEEAAYSKNTKSLNKARSLTSKKLNISKKDLQKLNLKIEANSSIRMLSSKQNKSKSSKNGIKLYSNKFFKLIIGVFLILTIASGTYVFAPEISKHIPQAENSLKIYKSKVTYVFSNIKNSYMEFAVPQIDKFIKSND